MTSDVAGRAKRKLYMRKYWQEHKAELQAYQRRYAQEHREEIQEKRRAYREGHKEERRANRKRYHQQHLEQERAASRQYAKEHRIELRAYNRQYCRTEHGRAVRLRNQRRRQALKAGLPATFTQAEWQVALAHFENCCAYCGFSDERLEQDHVVPLVAGGAYVATNIVPACRRCNGSKRSSLLSDWALTVGVGFVLPDALGRVTGYLENAGVAE